MRAWVAAIGLFASALTAGLAAQRGPAGATCDRACLLGIADTYLAALVAHDPKRAPLAANVKFTEQTQVLMPG